MKLHAKVNLFATTIVAAAMLVSSIEAQEKQVSRGEVTIENLLQKQHAVLTRLVTVRSDEYRAGEGDVESVFHTRQRLLAVELQLAPDKKHRIMKLEESAKLARELEEFTTAKHKTGEASVTDVLDCQARRLDAEIEVLRERQRTEAGRVDK